MPSLVTILSSSHRGALLCLATIAAFGLGCDATQQVPGAQVLDSKLGGSIQGSFLVSSVKPAAVAPGEEATIEGYGLTDDITVLVNDEAAAIVKRIGDRSIVFKIPEGKPGMQTVVVRKDTEETSHPLVRLSDDGSPVVVGGEPKSMCKGEKFFTLTGTEMEGERDCAAAAPACREDGQTDCLASPEFPAADAESLAPKVKEGETVAGIAGAYAPDFPDPAHVSKDDTVDGAPGLLDACSADGATSCIATAAFPAADKSKLAPADILAGKTVAGVAGTATPAPPGCAADNATNCVATADFPAIDKASFTAGDIRATKTIAGIIGSVKPSPADCAADGATGCVAVAGFPAVDATRLSPGNIRKSIVIGAVTGEYPSAAHPLDGGDAAIADLPELNATIRADVYEWFHADGTRLTGSILEASGGNIIPKTSDQFFSGGVYRGFTVSGDPQLIASNIRAGATIFGVAGSGSARPPDCVANFDQDCVATATYRAADLSNLSAANVRKGVVVAGITGDYPSATNPLANDTAAADLLSLDQYAAVGSFEFFDSAGNVYTGIIADGGTVTPGTSDTTIGASGTVYRQVVVRGDADLAPTNLLSGVNIFNVVGDVAPLAPLCTSDAETDCTTTSAFRAAAMSLVNPGNIRSGITIAGVPGEYPSPTYPLAGSGGVDDLPQLDQAMTVGVFEYFDSAGSRFVATVADGGTVTPSTANQTVAAPNTVYRRVIVEGDTDLAAAKVAAGTTLFGVAGTAALRPADCAADGATDCVTTTSFKAADMTAVSAGTVRNGYTIAGVAGDFPSATHRLTGSSATPDLPSLDATTVANSYEWFASDGTRLSGTIGSTGTITPGSTDQSFTGVYVGFTVAGAATLVPGNITDGTSIFGVTGNAATRPADCGGNNLTGCVTTATYRSADLTNLGAGNIRNGVSIAGVTGQYPSATHPLSGNTATVDLPSLAATVAAGSYEWFQSDGTLVSGAIADAGTITPGATNQTFTASLYRQFMVSGDPDLDPANIKSGVELFGHNGSFTVGTGPGDCSADGQSGCVVTGGYVSASSALLLPGNIRAGISLGGVTGNYPSSTSPLVGSNATTDLTDALFDTAVRGAAAFEWFDSTGARHSRAGDTNLVASNIRTGIDILGVTGTVVEIPNVCNGDGQVGCVTSLSYKSANMASVTAGNVRSGVTIAGVTGTYPSATTPLIGADTTSDLTTGSFVSVITSAADFEWFDASGTRYTRAGDADLAASNLRSGTDVFGLVGTVTPTPANCSTDGALGCVTVTGFPSAKLANFAATDVTASITIAGVAGSLAQCSADAQTDCVANAGFKAADMTNNAVAGKIKSGAVIAGVTGAYPSATYKLASDTATADLPALGSAMALNSYEYWQADGTRLTGTIADRTVASTATNQTVNAASTVYRTITVTGDADLVASKILSGINILGVTGTVAPRPADCASDGATGCVATTSYKAADMSNTIASNIRSGKTIAAVAGTYGPACSSEGQADCLTASSSTFRAANTSGIAPHIRAGTNIAGVSGSLKLCRNTANTWGVFNRIVGWGASAGLDFYDTIDDYNNGIGSTPGPVLPTEQPFGANHACTNGWTDWTDMTLDYDCSPGDTCIFRDNVTRQYWLEEKTNVSWEDAITYCDGFSTQSAGGTWMSNWRVPTHKEMLQAYIDGFHSIRDQTSNFATSYFNYGWTSTSVSYDTSNAYFVIPAIAYSAYNKKNTNNYSVWCVHD